MPKLELEHGRLCPCCPNQLMDYVGGSHPEPYADAVNFFQTISTLEEETDTLSCVVRDSMLGFLEQILWL